MQSSFAKHFRKCFNFTEEATSPEELESEPCQTGPISSCIPDLQGIKIERTKLTPCPLSAPLPPGPNTLKF